MTTDEHHAPTASGADSAALAGEPRAPVAEVPAAGPGVTAAALGAGVEGDRASTAPGFVAAHGTASQFPSRRLAPPPKPSRDSRPSEKPPQDNTVVASIPALRTPMIVVGGQPSKPVQREGAQAWNRPSEPPRSGAQSIKSSVPPRREPPPRKSEAVRQQSEGTRQSAESVPPPPVSLEGMAAADPEGAFLPNTASAPLADPPGAVPLVPQPAAFPAPPVASAMVVPPPLKALAQPAPAASSRDLPSPLASVPPQAGALQAAPAAAFPAPAKALSAFPAPSSPVSAFPPPALPPPVLSPPAGAPSAGAAGDGTASPLQRTLEPVLLPPPPAPDPIGAAATAERVEAPHTQEASQARPALEPAAAEPSAGDERRAADPVARAPASEPPRADAPLEAAARPKSEPARLRGGGGPGRARASSPGFAGVRPASTPPRPGSSGSALESDIPPSSRLPDFASTSTARGETTSERRSSEPPVAPAAIVVMKIVGAVSDSPEESSAPSSDDWQRSADPPEIDITVDPELQQPVPLASTSPRDELEELSEEDVAPDSGDRLTPTPRAAAGEAPLSTRPSSGAAATPAMASSPPSLREGELGPKPPPPPKRAQANPALPKSVPQAKRRQKRPWWEEIFGEDFVRAGFKVSERQIRREVDFIEDSLGVATGGVMLDLGCGSGHHAVELASRGYGVVGYDLSLYQLALASDVAQERGQKLNFLQGDMREMAFDEMFDGIFCWNTTFGYFEEEKNLLVAERVFRALRPGGMFLIDVVNRDFVATQSPCSLWYEGDGCVCMDDMSVDFITSRLRVKRSVILDDGRTRECVYSVRLYSLHELGKLLHEVGFRVTEASGHPTTPGVFFGEQSPRMIVLAQKP